MKHILAFLVCFTAIVCTAQEPIFEPGMLITGFGTVDSPIGEEVDKIIDGDVNTKFLDFELGDGMGFTVNLGGNAATAFSIDLTTANDFPVRDPIEFEVLGSNDATNYTSLLVDALPCIMDRFETRSFSIPNTESYLFYRINFPAPCDPSGGTGIPSIQLAEVQLFQEILNVDDSTLFSDQLQISPNPTQGAFNLYYSGSKTLQTATISDIGGKIIQTIDLSNFSKRATLELSGNAAGIYFIRIEAAETSVVKRIILQ